MTALELPPDPFAPPTVRPEEPLGPLRVNGRYVLPDPLTDEMRSWQSVTNHVRALDDAFALARWSESRLAWGLAQRPGLVAHAASLTLEPEDKDSLCEIIEEAKDAAGAHEGAHLGSALHRWTERIDREEIGFDDVAEDMRADVEAYYTELTLQGLHPMSEMIERTTVNPEYGTAGTFDRMLNYLGPQTHGPCLLCAPGTLYMSDLKTGKNEVLYGQMKTTMQLTHYAQGASRWLLDPRTRRWVAQDRPVCPHIGIVMWLPVGGARCELKRVNLTWGAALLALAADVIDARARSRCMWETF